MITVRVHPRFAIPYYAFYLEGLGRVFGHASIVFDRHDAPAETEFNDGFACTLSGGPPGYPKNRRLYISANDWARYDRVALSWCDRYGMINHAPDAPTGGDHAKVIPIGPSFGIRDWGGVARTARAIGALLADRKIPAGKYMNELQLVKRQLFDRLPERGYVPGQTADRYVFYVSWPWKKHVEVNPPRARFIRACRDVLGDDFEGGFAPRRRRDIDGLDDVTARKIYPFREWVAKTQSSATVFNCPAVHECFGWKLGEYLAFGKAMVSLPLSRVMPFPLVHGEHIHYAEDSAEALRDAVDRVVSDRPYRTRLEIAARRYYLQHLAPERVISRLAFET